MRIILHVKLMNGVDHMENYKTKYGVDDMEKDKTKYGVDDMENYKTKYGVLKNIGEHTIHPNGALKECMITDREELETSYGVLIPQYEFEEHRRKYIYSLSFYEDGSLHKIALNERRKIITPLGEMEAELIIFHHNGSIKRLFPLNGRISAYWDENEEYKLAKTDIFDTPLGTISTKVIAYSFFENGLLKDLTLWPQERLKLNTPVGEMGIRIGISFYQEGAIKSFEPAYPVLIHTPIGLIKAYDSTANGISGDQNSLTFLSNGEVESIITSDMKLHIKEKNSNVSVTYSPIQNLDEDGIEINFQPLKITFDQKHVIMNDGVKYSLSDHLFTVESYVKIGQGLCSNCASCGKCQ